MAGLGGGTDVPGKLQPSFARPLDQGRTPRHAEGHPRPHGGSYVLLCSPPCEQVQFTGRLNTLDLSVMRHRYSLGRAVIGSTVQVAVDWGMDAACIEAMRAAGQVERGLINRLASHHQ